MSYINELNINSYSIPYLIFSIFIEPKTKVAKELDSVLLAQRFINEPG